MFPDYNQQKPTLGNFFFNKMMCWKLTKKLPKYTEFKIEKDVKRIWIEYWARPGQLNKELDQAE